MRQDTRNLPYGGYQCRDGSIVLHDRHYRPIVRCAGNGRSIDALAFDRDKRPLPIVLPLANVSPVGADERVDHTAQFWFYSDINSPRRDPRTRKRLAALVADIPAIAAVVATRH